MRTRRLYHAAKIHGMVHYTLTIFTINLCNVYLPWCVCNAYLPWCVCNVYLPWCVCNAYLPGCVCNAYLPWCVCNTFLPGCVCNAYLPGCVCNAYLPGCVRSFTSYYSAAWIYYLLTYFQDARYKLWFSNYLQVFASNRFVSWK